MSHIPEFERGTTVTLKTTITDDNGEVVQPDNKDVSLKIEDLSTGEIVLDTSMRVVSDTQYAYDWNTTDGMSLGEYGVQAEADLGNEKYRNKDRIVLTDIIRF